MNLIVCWDWAETLVSSRLFIKNFSKQLEQDLARSINEQNISFEEARLLKEKINSRSQSYIPYTWFLVKNFHSRGVTQFIISNGSCEDIKKELGKNAFYFKEILASSNFKPKPDPEMLNYVKAKYNKKVCFIGDSFVDEEAAKNAQVEFRKIENPYVSSMKIAKSFGFI